TKLVEGVKQACHGIDSKFGPNDARQGVPLGRCVVTSGRLDHMITFAWSLSPDMVRGTPASLSTNDARFDVEAKADDRSTATEQALLEMLRSLLIDRFRLTFHLETRQQQGFALMLAKNGPKLEKAAGSAKAPTVAGITTTDGKFTVGIADAKGADAPSIKSAP